MTTSTAKKNTTRTNDRTLPHPLDDAAPDSEQHPKLSVYRDVEDDKLVEMRDAIVAEIKRRKEETKAKQPKVGDKVEITGGKFAGKKGAIVKAGSTKANVQVDGFVVQQYIAFADLKAAEG